MTRINVPAEIITGVIIACLFFLSLWVFSGAADQPEKLEKQVDCYDNANNIIQNVTCVSTSHPYAETMSLGTTLLILAIALLGVWLFR